MMKSGMKTQSSTLQKRMRLEVETRSDQKKKPTAIQKKSTTIKKHRESAEQTSPQVKS